MDVSYESGEVDVGDDEGGDGMMGLASMQTVDWDVLDAKFEELHSTLSAPLAEIISDIERARVRRNAEAGLHAIIELAQADVARLLTVGDFETALHGATRTLRYTQKLFQSNCEELIRSEMLLARCFYHLRKFAKAEEFFSLANWGLLKLGGRREHLRVELHTGYGLLFVELNRLEKALHELSQAVYFQSTLTGPRSPATAVQYFHLGQAFLQAQRIPEAQSLFDHVQEIFSKILLEGTEEQKASLFETQDPAFCLDLLHGICQAREDHYGEQDLRTGLVYRILGLLYEFIADPENAGHFYRFAYECFLLAYGRQSEQTRSVRQLLVNLLGEEEADAQLAEFKSAQPTPRENRRETSPQEQGEQEQQPVQVEWEPPQEQVDGEALHEEQQVDGEQAPQGAPLDGEPELETELEVEGTLESAQEEGEKSSEADMVEPASRVVLVYGPLTFVMDSCRGQMDKCKTLTQESPLMGGLRDAGIEDIAWVADEQLSDQVMVLVDGEALAVLEATPGGLTLGGEEEGSMDGLIQRVVEALSQGNPAEEEEGDGRKQTPEEEGEEEEEEFCEEDAPPGEEDPQDQVDIMEAHLSELMSRLSEVTQSRLVMVHGLISFVMDSPFGQLEKCKELVLRSELCGGLQEAGINPLEDIFWHGDQELRNEAILFLDGEQVAHLSLRPGGVSILQRDIPALVQRIAASLAQTD